MIVWIGFANLSFGIDGVDGEIARPAGWPRAMEVKIRIQRVGVEVVDRCRELLWDVAIAHGFTNHRAVFAFCERVVVGLARP